MRNPCLKVQLLDPASASSENERDPEAASASVKPLSPAAAEAAGVPSAIRTITPEEAQIEAEVRRWRLDYPPESPEERHERTARQERGDGAILVFHSVVLVIYVLSCAVAMWFSPLELLELLFALAFVQGPLAVYQRSLIARSRERKEAMAALYSEMRSLRDANFGLEIEVSGMKKAVERLKVSTRRYNSLLAGFDFRGITDLYDESERIKLEKKYMAEAIGLQRLARDILATDPDRDHHVGDHEADLHARRVELVEGVPFRGRALGERFRREEDRTLRNLAHTVMVLYVERRREQRRARDRQVLEKSPKNLGAPLLWRRRPEDGDGGFGVALSSAVC